jgi:hypothetical protein
MCAVSEVSPCSGSTAASASGEVVSATGTLDDTSWVKPVMEIYCDSAQPWVSLGSERQRFPKMRPCPERETMRWASEIPEAAVRLA